MLAFSFLIVVVSSTTLTRNKMQIKYLSLSLRHTRRLTYRIKLTLMPFGPHGPGRPRSPWEAEKKENIQYGDSLIENLKDMNHVGFGFIQVYLVVKNQQSCINTNKSFAFTLSPLGRIKPGGNSMTSSGPCGPGGPCSPWNMKLKGWRHLLSWMHWHTCTHPEAPTCQTHTHFHTDTHTPQTPQTSVHSCQKWFLTSSPLSPASDRPGSPYTATKSLVRFCVCVDVCLYACKDFLLQHALAKIVEQVTHW